MIVVGRWFWTSDRKRLVLEGDPGAAFLAYPDGEEIADPEARRVGLLGREPSVVPEKKAVRRSRDKMMPAPQDK